MQSLMDAGDEDREFLEPYVPWFPWIERFTARETESEFILYLHLTVNTKKRTAAVLLGIFLVVLVSYIISMAVSTPNADNFLVQNHNFWYLVYYIIASAITYALWQPKAVPRHLLYEGMFALHMTVAIGLHSFWTSGKSSNKLAEFLPMHTIIFYAFTLAIVPRVILAAFFGLGLVTSSLIWVLVVSSDAGTGLVLVGSNLLQVIVLLMFCGDLERTFRTAFLRAKGLAANEAMLTHQKNLTDTLLNNILPVTIVNRLNSGSLQLGNVFERFRLAGVLFADIVSFTKWSSSLDAERVGNILHKLMSLLDDRCSNLKCEKVKTVGDAYWVVVGVPDIIPTEDLCYRLSEFALSMPRIMSKVNDRFGTSLVQRIGVHCGAITAGIIGKTKFSYDVWGSTMDRCIDLEAGGVGNKVHVSTEYKALLSTTTNSSSMYRCIDSNLGTAAEPTYFLVDDVDDVVEEPVKSVATETKPVEKSAIPKPKPLIKKTSAGDESSDTVFAWGDFSVDTPKAKDKKGISSVQAVLKAQAKFEWGDFSVPGSEDESPAPQIAESALKTVVRRRVRGITMKQGPPNMNRTQPHQAAGADQLLAEAEALSVTDLAPPAPKDILVSKTSPQMTHQPNSTDDQPSLPGMILEEKKIPTPTKEKVYAAPAEETFVWGDFQVDTSPPVRSAGRTLTDNLVSMLATRRTEPTPKEKPPPQEKQIHLSTSRKSSVASAASTVSDGEFDHDDPNSPGSIPPLSPNSKNIFQDSIRAICENPQAHEMSWDLSFRDPVEESLFKQTRNVRKAEAAFTLRIGFVINLGLLLLWLYFNISMASNATSIVLYIICSANVVMCIVQHLMSKSANHAIIYDLLLYLNMCLDIIAFFVVFNDHPITGSDTFLFVARHYFCLTLLPVVQLGRKHRCWYGVFLCLLCAQGNLLTQVLRHTSVKEDDMYWDEIIAVIAAYVICLREKGDRQIFVSVVSGLGGELKLDSERSASEFLLYNVLPPSVAKQLRENSVAFIFERKESCSVIFLDILGYTDLIGTIEQEDEHDMDLCRVLNNLFSSYDDLCKYGGVEKIKSIGSVYLAVVGAPDARADHASAAVSVAFNMLQIASKMLVAWPALSVRIGIQTGPLVGGVLGTRKFSYDIFGDTVNTASRLMSTAKSKDIQISLQTYELLPQTILEKYLWESTRLELKGKGSVDAFVLHNMTRRAKEARHNFRLTHSPTTLPGEVPEPGNQEGDRNFVTLCQDRVSFS